MFEGLITNNHISLHQPQKTFPLDGQINPFQNQTIP